MVKRELAERMAATAVEGLTVETARAVIAEYLDALSTCPVCNGTGRFTFGRRVDLEVLDRHRRPVVAEGGRSIAPGTIGSCPRCADGSGDPDWVVWHCTLGHAEQECRHEGRAPNGTGAAHDECGYRLMLPLPETNDH